MTEPSAVNSHESKHRLANIRLTEKEHLKQSPHHHPSIDINTKEYS